MEVLGVWEVDRGCGCGSPEVRASACSRFWEMGLRAGGGQVDVVVSPLDLVEGLST